ncbi:hypothetical protein RHGRI_030411 [Rhododendron griersonianum]|uniref:Response regulatory domain-containing protein n=1 Tax=Rhododendron griersonianum TaxID=479676 RepID=A0AAV6IQ14_9ERIC|nr:hypothetical protein RHGRI_030411 [Rhododendron griersonianum]
MEGSGHKPSVDVIESAHDKVIMQKFYERRNPKINVKKYVRAVNAISCKSEAASELHLKVAISLMATMCFMHDQLESIWRALFYRQVLLALNGRMGRLIMSQWLQKNEVFTWEASEWNELTQILQEIFQAKSHAEPRECSKAESLNKQRAMDSISLIVVYIGLLDLNTVIWREQNTASGSHTGTTEGCNDNATEVGASVVVVGDGMQAVDALSVLENDYARNETKIGECPSYDLILMDCQVRCFKLMFSSCFDYMLRVELRSFYALEQLHRTKAIRKLEMERGSHIPIVALTARAMSSDEAKCLEEGMDAYLTKPWCPPSFR